MNAISLDSAIIITEISKRTLWRRLTDGQITRVGTDERGRAMLAFDDLVPLLCIPVAQEDYELFFAADAGDAHAQNDLAQLFLDAGKPGIALFWLQSAVSSQQSAVSSQQSAVSSQQSAVSSQRGRHAQSCQALFSGNWRAAG